MALSMNGTNASGGHTVPAHKGAFRFLGANYPSMTQRYYFGRDQKHWQIF
jgi:hypothetical protein